MKRAHRVSQRLVRWTSLCVTFALVLTSLVVPFTSVSGKNGKGRYRTARGSERVNHAPETSATQGQGNGQGRRVNPPTPQPGPPPGRLPNLDDMKRATDQDRRNGGRRVHAPDPVPSTQKQWRHGQQQAEVRGQRTVTHFQMAEAASAFGTFTGWSAWGGGFPDRASFAAGHEGNQQYDGALSGFWNNILTQKCPLGK